ncbi:signal transduction histidine kinase [Glaciihabitans tibetensis]|uniref:Signal transduction histidine kinase n=1 Tax=Glaciihabitans tibetensis TaxID=1266600 RepID=A0A2T0V3H6_9MICO|nr:ATP-binding protein [Glaciihabitans tibetensis]PRY64618.1 signal transduction histidine kinase [Glaciihabitans tibetensis]
MSPELPAHLTPRAVSHILAKTLHAPAFILIAGCLVAAVTLQAADPDATLWPAFVAATAMLTTLALLDRWRTLLLTLLHLAAGGAAAYVFIYTLADQIDATILSDEFVVALPTAALILVGGSGAGAASGFRWCAAGFAVAQSAALVALVEARGATRLPLAPVLIFLGVTVVLALHWLARRGDSRVQPRLRAAERAEHLAAIRRRAEVEASALTHDTILNHLAVIATTPTGQPSAALSDQLERDVAALTVLAGGGTRDSRVSDVGLGAGSLGDSGFTDSGHSSLRDSSVGDGARPAPSEAGAWQRTPLFGAIQAARAQGLTVLRTGDPGPVAMLDPDAAAALGLAVAECLANVAQHSGVAEAEVAIDASEATLVVLVIDAGTGFAPAEVPNDRLGIKNSVRARIEATHGTVTVWSSPGAGTSVILRLPFDAGTP